MYRLRSLFITISILPACLHAEPLKPEVVKRAAKAIDTYLERDYSSYRVIPEARVDDGTFVRRAYLLIVGRIPTAEEAKTFIEERSMDKRAKLIDRLVASPGYESHFFNWAGDLLRVRTITGREKHGLGWHVWLRKSVSEDKHWDDMVKEMLKSSGHAAKDPAVGYYLRDRSMQLDNFSNTMQVFLGQQMGCAQCHDHPFDDWTQYDYYQMAAFTGGMQYRSEDLQAMVKRVAEENRNGKANAGNAKANRRQEMGMMRATGRSLQPFFRYLNSDAVLEKDSQALRLPKDYKYSDGKPGEVVEPATLFGPKIENVAPEKRKDVFADWVTSPENPFFTKTIVNRMWERVFGFPLYDSLDDLKSGSKTAHPKLAATLEEYMKHCDYDLRQFQRILFHTKLFERTAMAKEPERGQPTIFRGMVLRRMSAEQIYDSFLVMNNGKITETMDTSMANRWQSHVSMVESVFKAPAKNLLELAQRAVDGEKQLRQAQAAYRAAQIQMRDANTREQKIEAQAAINRLRKQMLEARESANPLSGASMMMSESGADRTRKGLLRASELPAPFNPGSMVRQFGGSDRETPSSGQTHATVPQVLTLLNNWSTHPLGSKNNYIAKNLGKMNNDNEKLEYLFLSILGVKPQPNETSKYISVVSNRQTLSDLAAAMVNSKRFIFIQ